MKVSKSATDDMWSNYDTKRLDRYWNTAVNRSQYFVEQLKSLDFNSIYEIGFFSGRNLYYIQQAFPSALIGGTDINKYAVDYASKKLNKAALENLKITELNQNPQKWDVVFTMGVLIHIPDIDCALSECVKKANKYVIHIEANGKDEVVRGPKELNPKISSYRFEWAPNIYDRYVKMGLNVSCVEMPKEIWAKDATHLIVVKL